MWRGFALDGRQFSFPLLFLVLVWCCGAALASPPRVPKLEEIPLKEQDQQDQFGKAWQQNAIAPVRGTGPRIVLIMDDIGLSKPAVTRLKNFPPMTLALLPYADDVAESAQILRKAGHELLVHMPMATSKKPGDPKYKDPGPNALLLGLSEKELDRRIQWNLSRFKGYVGVNNHMGSGLTAEVAPMLQLMLVLKQRGLIYVDSLTTPESLGRRSARSVRTAFLARDIFLDNDRKPAKIRARLGEMEAIARRRGEVIAICHPYPETLDVLEAWFKDLDQKTLQLVPVSQAWRERLLLYPEG